MPDNQKSRKRGARIEKKKLVPTIKEGTWGTCDRGAKNHSQEESREKLSITEKGIREKGSRKVKRERKKKNEGLGRKKGKLSLSLKVEGKSLEDSKSRLREAWREEMEKRIAITFTKKGEKELPMDELRSSPISGGGWGGGKKKDSFNRRGSSKMSRLEAKAGFRNLLFVLWRALRGGGGSPFVPGEEAARNGEKGGYCF